METLCEGESGTHICPLRDTCYRYTCPIRFRDRYLFPYDLKTGACDLFVTNIPSEDAVRMTAYFMWQREGQPAGKAEEHWRLAYEQLACGMNRFLNP